MINPDSSSPFSPREQTRDLSSSDPGGVVGHAAAAHCRVWLDTTWPCKAGAWSRGFYQSVVRHGRPNPFSAWPGMLEKVRMISGIRKQQPGLPGKPGKGPPDAKFSLFTSLHTLLATALTAFAAALTGTQYVRVGGQGPAVL